MRPDYFELAKIDLPDAPAHLIELIHREAAIFEQKKLATKGREYRELQDPDLERLANICRSLFVGVVGLFGIAVIALVTY